MCLAKYRNVTACLEQVGQQVSTGSRESGL
jgi:hypothetical protein